MLTGNITDVGLWKCGKGGAFTHIPTNLIILLKKIDFDMPANMKVIAELGENRYPDFKIRIAGLPFFLVYI